MERLYNIQPKDATQNGVFPANSEMSSISLYMVEIGRIPLLTFEQEQELGRQSLEGQRGADKIEQGHYNGDLKRLEAAVALGVKARKRLVESNTRLVVSIARRIYRPGQTMVSFDELIQEGNMGLMKAAQKFDYRRGYKFSTYATWWIRQSVGRGIANLSRTIRMPVHAGDRLKLIRDTQRDFLSECGQHPTPEEISEGTGIDLAEVKRLLDVGRLPISIDEPLDPEASGGTLVLETIEAEGDPFASIDLALLGEALDRVLNTLSPREAHILRLRFGLLDGQPHTLEAVAQKYDLTRERIRQIEAEALKKLRHPRRARKLKDYLEER